MNQNKKTILISTLIAFILVTLVILLAINIGFIKSFDLGNDFVRGTFKKNSQNTTNINIIENRTFEEDRIINTSLNKYNVNNGQNCYKFNLLTFQNPVIKANNVNINGPYGFEIKFKKAIEGIDYGLDNSYGIVLDKYKEDSIQHLKFINYNESYIYISVMENNEYVTKHVVSGELWNSIKENNWCITFKNESSLIYESGRYQIIIMLKQYTFQKLYDKYELVDSDFLHHTYNINANINEYDHGILIKNSDQDDYKFQLSTNLSDLMIVPTSEKIEVNVESDFYLNILSSTRYSIKEARLCIYKLDEYTRRGILEKQIPLEPNSDGRIDEQIIIDYTNMKSGLYKIVIEAEAKTKLFKIKSIGDFFNIFKYKVNEEQYEYYIKIGDII